MRLRHIGRAGLTISRVRKGRGFAYFTEDGAVIRDKAELARFRALGLPPAWAEVRIAADPRAHLQAAGLDAAGRVQYRYHPDWETRRRKRKEAQLSLLIAALPRLRARVRHDLTEPAGSKQLALALGVALIDRTAMRVGRERYLYANGTRGAGTLMTRDVSVRGDVVTLSFPAKSGKRALYRLADAAIAEAVKKVKTIPGARLLMYRGEDGGSHALQTAEINRYLKDVTGVAVTAKDFRTLHASAMAGEALAALEPGSSERARKKQMAEVTRQVAAFLQNTPAICRSSYIAPKLYELFDRRQLGPIWTGATGPRETRLIEVLGGKPG